MTALPTLTDRPTGAPPRLQLSGISKRYPGVVANSDIALSVLPGQIHAVLGENGAGKSTLMKIIYGSVKPDAGSMAIDGQPVAVRNPQEARALGISMVFQHFSLFDTLTVAENVWLGLGKRRLVGFQLIGFDRGVHKQRGLLRLRHTGRTERDDHDQRTGPLSAQLPQCRGKSIGSVHFPSYVGFPRTRE